MSHGGATSTGSKWGMGGKTWRAPSEAKRTREAHERLNRESERRRIQEIQHVERNIRRDRELEAQAARSTQRALGVGLGRTRDGPSRVRSGYSPVAPRIRSSSFSGIGSSPFSGSYPGSSSLGISRLGAHGDISLFGAAPGLGFSAEGALQRERLRSQTRALEAEALRREHHIRSMSREPAAFALVNECLLTPRVSPRLGYINTCFSGGVPSQSLGRPSSWHGCVPVGAYGNPSRGGYAHSPRLAPPRIGQVGLPSLHPYGAQFGYRSRSPSAGRVVVSPRVAQPPSPHVGNYDTPRMLYDDSGLGALNVMSLGEAATRDPLVLDDYGRIGGGGPAHVPDFVVTDASLVSGRRILRDLGPVEGLSGFDTYATEDERLNLAISDLTAHAQAFGANAVLSVETGEDVAGQVAVRGVAALLS